MELSRKITIATVSGGPAKWFEKLVSIPPNEAGVKAMKLCSIYGFAGGWKPFASEFGEGVKFLGQFRAINADTGEVTTSPQCILPTYIADALKAALDAEGRTAPVKFAFDIGVKFDPLAVTKYVYVVNDVMPAQADDPLSALGASVGYEKPLAITSRQAPTPANDAETEPATKPARHHRK